MKRIFFLSLIFIVFLGAATPENRRTVPNYSQIVPSKSDTTEVFTTTNGYVCVDSSTQIMPRGMYGLVRNLDADGDIMDVLLVFKASPEAVDRDTIVNTTISAGNAHSFSYRQYIGRFYFYAKSDSLVFGRVSSGGLLY